MGLNTRAPEALDLFPRAVEDVAAAPFLKWAGGKRQLLPALRRFYPASFRSYYEPFIGSGAVLFDLQRIGRLSGCTVTIADRNADLIGCYKAIRRDVEEVIAALQALEAGHRADPQGHYYDVRDRRFNPQRAALAAAAGDAIDESYPPHLAAMLIYLNRTGFNGLFRMNATGGFNVPAGRYAAPRICDAPNLRRVADVLRGPGFRFVRGSFADGVLGAKKGDFVYLDPPYAPLSRTAAFTAYTADGFSFEDQRRLQQLVMALTERGCHVLLSNSTASEIEALYVTDATARAAGLVAHRVPARRAINSRASGRGEVLEYLITNIALS
jgi:DNA adenine methylase